MEFDWWNTIQVCEKLSMFMKSNDWVCSDGTLEVVFMVHDGM